jgi:hypothetical protein
MNSKLLKAWEVQVFPKIRSRFQRESDRQAGYEQIKGALQSGMPELAKMIIEGLFDDGRGIPADLHLPTFDDLKASANTLGASQLKKGMRVAIQHTPERTGYEVRGMELTRNKIGVVVNVDAKKLIAQVDVYLEEEACLVGYWYPISVLQRALQYSTDIEVINRGAEAHNELLVWESKLTRLYSSTIILQLLEHDLLQAPTIAKVLTSPDVLRLLSFHQQRLPVPGSCFVRQSTAALFFNWTGKNRSMWLQHLQGMLTRSIEAEELNSLVHDICGCLLTSQFKYTELVIDNGRKNFNVDFPSCGMIAISLKARDNGSQRVIAKPPSTKDGPWARLYCGTDANGPQFATFPATNPGADPPPYVLIPSSKLHIRTTGQDGSPNAALLAHGIPLDFPLAVAFVQQVLVLNKSVPDSILIELVSGISNVLLKSFLAPVVREVLLHTFALLLRRIGESCPALEPILDETHKMHSELKSLFEFANQSSTNTYSKYPTYFSAVFEAVMAQWEVVGDADVSEEASTSPVPPKPVRGHMALKRKPHRKRQHETPVSSAPEDYLLPAKRISTYLRTMLRRTDTALLAACSGIPDSDHLPLSLMKAAWSSCSSFGYVKRFVIIQGIPLTLAADDARAVLGQCIRVNGGLLAGGIFLPVGENGKTLGSAVVELKSANNVPGFKAAVLERPEFRTMPTPTKIVFPDFTFTERIAVAKSVVELDSAPSEIPVAPPLPGSSQVISIDDIIDQFLAQMFLDNGRLKPDVELALCQLVHSKPGRVDLASITRTDAIISIDQLLASIPADPSQITFTRSLPEVIRSFFSVAGFASEAALKEVFAKHGFGSSSLLSFDGLSEFVRDLVVSNSRKASSAFVAFGFDLRANPVRPFTFNEALKAMSLTSWGHATDIALVQHVNSLSRSLHSPSKSLHPGDYQISDAELAQEEYVALQQIGLGDLRFRFAVLQEVNSLFRAVIPFIDLRYDYLPQSLAWAVYKARGYFFYDVKEDFFDGRYHQRDLAAY